MSQATAARATRPAPRPSSRPAAPGRRLRAVSAPPQTRSRAGVALVCLASLVAGLVCLLMVNISLSHGAYEMYELQQQRVQLSERAQALSEQNADAQSPISLERAARSLGMVPAGQVGFIHLKDGGVSGAADAATGVPSPTVGDRP